MGRRLFSITFLVLVSIEMVAQNNELKTTIHQADSLFQMKDWMGAVSLYEKVLKAKPDNSLAWNRLGFSYHNLLNYDKSISCYLKSIEYRPNPSLEIIVQSRLARVYSVKSDIPRAFESLNRALQLGYSNISELETQVEFAYIRRDAQFEQVLKRANENAYPCLVNKKAREFDFWIGEWDAFVTGTMNLAGHSKIEMASGGCMILENWSSEGQPFKGKSINFVDPATNKWKQIWVGSGGVNVSEFLNGEYRDGAMRFEFETTDAKGNKQWVHFYFYNQGPNQVRQFHETSSDGGKTWTTTYDFTYNRKM